MPIARTPHVYSPAITFRVNSEAPDSAALPVFSQPVMIRDWSAQEVPLHGALHHIQALGFATCNALCILHMHKR